MPVTHGESGLVVLHHPPCLSHDKHLIGNTNSETFLTSYKEKVSQKQSPLVSNLPPDATSMEQKIQELSSTHQVQVPKVCHGLKADSSLRQEFLSKEKKAIVKTEYGNSDWLKLQKGVRQGSFTLSPYLFNL
ncbi:hypothetical protein LAZ67_2001817 [Cordylochernes scorpioides]|uniref:Uncharacterized protein n=1 Tax=Cordylochernes scorpioides TaxID=51811 RepID=A0ABY6K1T3_9ARAC|nr:hypothetical protein LAZ67_2001817 [Cordylochernes scorpioides]